MMVIMINNDNHDKNSDHYYDEDNTHSSNCSRRFLKSFLKFLTNEKEDAPLVHFKDYSQDRDVPIPLISKSYRRWRRDVENIPKLYPGPTIQSMPCRPQAGFGLVL